jgi:DNA-binding MurR/RpiR family transcriptional regulator
MICLLLFTLFLNCSLKSQKFWNTVAQTDISKNNESKKAGNFMLIKDQLAAIPKATSSEQAIIEYFVSNPHELEQCSTRSLAKKLYCSPSSIVRFCQKLGFGGFEDFRKQYMDEVHYLESSFQNIDPNFPFKKEDSAFQIAPNLSTLYQETIQDTHALIAHGSLKQALRMIENNEIIYVLASSSQIGIADSFQDKMAKIGKPVFVLDHTDYAYYQASFLEKGKGCFILISYTGETERCLRIAQKLCEKHVDFLTITSFGKNSLSALSKCRLYVSTREKLTNNLGTYGMNLSVLYLLDVLYSLYFNLNHQANYENKTEISKEYEEYSASTSRQSDNVLIQ